MQEGRIQKEWRMGLIVPIWKRTGDVHDPGKYRGITLLSQVPKLLERVLDAMIRRREEVEQQGSRKGRGTADGMYVLRQTVEKILEVQGIWLWGSSIWTKKPLTQYPERWWWRRYGGWEYQKRKWGRLRACTRRQQQEWWWEKEHRRSLRSRWTQLGQRAEPAAVHILHLKSRNTVMKDAMKKLLYADDLALVENGKQELQETLAE